MAKLYAPNGDLITGTVESVIVVYGINSAERGEDGGFVVEYDSMGGDICYDTAEQIVRDGQRVYQSEDGSEYLENELVLREDDEEGEE